MSDKDKTVEPDYLRSIAEARLNREPLILVNP
jgi:hypothetical protein